MKLLTKQQTIRCPNCGSKAERHYFTSKEKIDGTCLDHTVIQTECAVCDYLLVMCSLDGTVIEAQAHGTGIRAKSTSDYKPLKDDLALSLMG